MADYWMEGLFSTIIEWSTLFVRTAKALWGAWAVSENPPIGHNGAKPVTCGLKFGCPRAVPMNRTIDT